MFNKLKQFKEMRNKAKTLQSALADEKIDIEHKGIKITFDGNQKITSLSIQPTLTSRDIEKIFPDLLNDGIKKVQKIMVQKMQSMGGMDSFKL